ncbi:MAG: class I SAM-dependent methyltransferase [Candidatus Paceibacterota bacterium]
MINLATTLRSMRSIDGWLTDKEGAVLYTLAQACPSDMAIVEIGSWKGRSTLCLASGSTEGNSARVYAIDPHTGSKEHQQLFGQVWTFDEFKNNLEKHGVAQSVTPIVSTSAEAAETFAGTYNQTIGLLFIDGDHSYESAKEDLELWFPKVAVGGIVAFHDALTWEGVSRLVDETVYRSPHFKKPRIASSTVYAQKVDRNTQLDRLENRARLFLKKVFQNKRVLIGYFRRWKRSLKQKLKRV